MAKNDYFVIVYRFLSYLYECLKNEETVDIKQIQPYSDIFPVGYKYLAYIIESLLKEGYIENASVMNTLGNESVINLTTRTRITPKGIEYLSENSTMNKVKKAVGSVVDVINMIKP